MFGIFYKFFIDQFLVIWYGDNKNSFGFEVSLSV